MEKTNTEKEIDLDLRSVEVQEILSFMPNWLIRWGSLAICLLLLLLLCLSCIIKYPDMLNGQVNITTETPPVKMVNITSGRILKLYKQDNEPVHKGEIIAEIESNTSSEAIGFLEDLISKGSNISPEDFETSLSFGQVQTDLNLLKKGVIESFFYDTENIIPQRIAHLRAETEIYRELNSINKVEIQLISEEILNATERFEGQNQLYDSGIISQNEFFREKELLNQKKKELNELKKNSLLNNITINKNQKLVVELIRDDRQQKIQHENLIAQSIANIENFIGLWEQNSLITSPIDGKISFLSDLHENLFVANGQETFAITPNNRDYIVIANVQSRGFGKVSIGQKARIKIDNYPSHEYGVLQGKVSKINLFPENNSYRIYIALENGLSTNYNNSIQFSPEMAGTVEIITEDLRLIERFFFQLKELVTV